ncbi:hypothetical protein [Chitinophaga sp. YIM B06452]|uniref:hypothetical protein n=1 Tax=Chitinophaga sp. YIM B06452 TaxID=3082158 RepID=UPI0031FE6C84
MQKMTASFVLLVVLQLSVQAQNRRMVLSVPDSVGMKVQEHIIGILTTTDKKDFYCLLEADTGQTFRLTVFAFDPDCPPNPWVDLAHGVLLVNDRQIPLLFDYDFWFGTFLKEPPSDYGRQEQPIFKVLSLTDSYIIYFKKEGNILGVEQW